MTCQSTFSSTCFGHHYAHLQERRPYITAYGFQHLKCWLACPKHVGLNVETNHNCCMKLVSQIIPFPRVFLSRIYLHFSCFPCVPNAPPIIDFIILLSQGDNLSPDMSFRWLKHFSRTCLAIKNRQNYSNV